MASQIHAVAVKGSIIRRSHISRNYSSWIPEEPGFLVNEGLELREVTDDSPLSNTLRLGDKIAKVDGEGATSWNEEDFKDFLLERLWYKKKLMIVRNEGDGDGKNDIQSYLPTDDETEYGDDLFNHK